MQRVKFFKKFLMPCGLCAAIPAVKPVSPPANCPEDCDNASQPKKLIRPSDLPIYSLDDDCAKQMPWKMKSPPSALEEGIRSIRLSLRDVLTQYENVRLRISTFIETGREHSASMIDFLQEESNVMPRVGAVGIGGLTGLTLGLRGGSFKRIIYTSTGALAMAAICYPGKAQEGFDMVKHYASIGYNFIYGVEPGDPNQLAIHLPDMPKLKVPTSLSEFVDLAVDVGSTAVAAIQSGIKTATEKKEASTGSDSKDS